MNNVIAIEQNRFYVYGLFDRDVPFYIGKGKDTRAYDHVGEARRGSRLPVHKKIRSMQKEHEARILCDGLSETDAYELEELCIGTVGRRYDNTGPLLNLTSGGRGGTEGYIVKLTPKQRAKQLAALRSPEVRAKISAGVLASKPVLTPEGRAKIVACHTGKTLSVETRLKLAKKMKGRVSYIPNKEQRAAISERNRGRPVSKETRKKISDGVKKHGSLTTVQRVNQQVAVQRPVTCPHCNKTGANSIMHRWHFDNCKLKGARDE